ncbi:hypothetical protein YC2023_073993 [Brassica napus]
MRKKIVFSLVKPKLGDAFLVVMKNYQGDYNHICSCDREQMMGHVFELQTTKVSEAIILTNKGSFVYCLTHIARSGKLPIPICESSPVVRKIIKVFELQTTKVSEAIILTNKGSFVYCLTHIARSGKLPIPICESSPVELPLKETTLVESSLLLLLKEADKNYILTNIKLNLYKKHMRGYQP